MWPPPFVLCVVCLCHDALWKEFSLLSWKPRVNVVEGMIPSGHCRTLNFLIATGMQPLFPNIRRKRSAFLNGCIPCGHSRGGGGGAAEPCVARRALSPKWGLLVPEAWPSRVSLHVCVWLDAALVPPIPTLYATPRCGSSLQSINILTFLPAATSSSPMRR